MIPDVNWVQPPTSIHKIPNTACETPCRRRAMVKGLSECCTCHPCLSLWNWDVPRAKLQACAATPSGGSFSALLQRYCAEGLLFLPVVVQRLSPIRLFVTLWTAAHQTSLSFTISWILLKIMSIEAVMSSIRPMLISLFSSCPQSFPVSGTFQWLNTSDQVAKVLQLQFQHQSFQSIFRFDFLWDWLVWSPCCPSVSQESLSAP